MRIMQIYMLPVGVREVLADSSASLCFEVHRCKTVFQTRSKTSWCDAYTQAECVLPRLCFNERRPRLINSEETPVK